MLFCWSRSRFRSAFEIEGDRSCIGSFKNMYKDTLKIVVLGDSGVGKTSIRSSYLFDQFQPHHRVTIGADFIQKIVTTYDDRKVKLQIWDTAGQERFQSLSVSFFRNADAAILVYDITNSSSLHNLKRWIRLFLQHAHVQDSAQFPFILLGNKTDLEDQRRISSEKGMSMATELRSECYKFQSENLTPAILANKLRSRSSRDTIASHAPSKHLLLQAGQNTANFLDRWNFLEERRLHRKSSRFVIDSNGSISVASSNNLYFTADDVSSIEANNTMSDSGSEMNDSAIAESDEDISLATFPFVQSKLENGKEIPFFEISAKSDSRKIDAAFQYLASNVLIPKYCFDISDMEEQPKGIDLSTVFNRTHRSCC